MRAILSFRSGRQTDFAGAGEPPQNYALGRASVPSRALHYSVMRLIASLLLAWAPMAAQVNDDLDFLTNHTDGREVRQMLSRYLKAKAFAQLDERERTVAAIRTPAALDQRRAYIRAKLQAALGGPWPERTALNARTVATLDFPAFRIEKLIFESRPKFYVTASLYVPKNVTGKRPAILFPLGHEDGAKAHEAWQRVLVTFAQRGYVCLAWDTLGQGERLQFWDGDLRASKVGSATIEHTLLGLQTLLAGDPLARYTIWDGLRALDYLVSRPEVDPARIGLTGNSGGGTHTAYLGALDDRFAAAAPSCFITGWRRLLETIGPQDAEQVIAPMLADGLDHGDFILAFAPKPYRMLTAIRDFFSITGARNVFAETSRAYGASLSYFEADDGHGYTAPRRAQAFRFFSRWLEGEQSNEREPEMRILSEQELFVTRSGQVAGEIAEAASVHSLNLARVASFRRAGELAEIRRVTAFAPAATGEPRTISYGATLSREKLTIEAEPGIALPALLYKPAGKAPFPATILAYGSGKASAHAEAQRLVAQGHMVLAIDLRGLGETRPVTANYGSDWTRWFGDYESAQTAMLTGKPLVTMRAEDLTRTVDWLAARNDVDTARISVTGRELAAIPALLAAAFDARIAKVRLERMLVSWQSLVDGRVHRHQWENAVPGALRVFDLPQLGSALGARAEVVDPVNALGQLVSQ